MIAVGHSSDIVLVTWTQLQRGRLQFQHMASVHTGCESENQRASLLLGRLVTWSRKVILCFMQGFCIGFEPESKSLSAPGGDSDMVTKGHLMLHAGFLYAGFEPESKSLSAHGGDSDKVTKGHPMLHVRFLYAGFEPENQRASLPGQDNNRNSLVSANLDR